MPNEDKREYIERYIKLRASDSVINLGKDLYNDGAVNLTYKNDVSDAWHFTVQGSQKYAVIIRDLNKKDLNTRCSCPLDWGSICKHSVAALMFIEDSWDDPSRLSLNQETKAQPASLRTALGYKIDDYKFITLDVIKKHASNSIVNDIMYYDKGYTISEVQVEPKDVVFTLNESGEEGVVQIRFRNKGVYISGGSSTGTPKLNRLEAFTLKLIAQSQAPDLLDIVFNKGLGDIEKDTLQRYGFDATTDFYKYFTHGFSANEGLIVSYKSDQIGLLPIESELTPDFLGFIEEMNNDALVLEDIPRASVERMLGFVIDYGTEYGEGDYDPYKFYDTKPGVSILPIIAKPNKTRSQLASHFEEYNIEDELHRVVISDNAKKALELIEKLNVSNGDKSDFTTKKHLLNLLVNENFVFIKQNGDFKIRKSDLCNIQVERSPIEAKYKVYEEGDFIGVRLQVFIEGEELNLNEIDRISKETYVYRIGGKVYVPKNYAVAKHIEQWQQEVKMVKEFKDQFVKDVILPLSRTIEIELDGCIDNLDSLELDFRAKQVFLSEQFDYLIITPQVEYHHGVSVTLTHVGNVIVPHAEGVKEYVRNFELEEDFVDSIAALHPNFEEQASDKRFYLHYDDFTRDMWFYKFFEQMQSQEVEVFGLKELKNFKYSPFQGKVSTTLSSGEDWFEVDINVSFGDTHIGLKEIRKAILNKEKYIQLKDGRVGLLPNEWLHKLEKYFRHGEVIDNKLKLSKLRFSIIDELFDEIDDVEVINEINQKRKKLAQFKEIADTVVPEGIKAELRPYQKEGLNWLNFLDEMGWGGILADDMGLGKTLQILTFVQHIIKKNPMPNLIVVPTTLLFNWEKELAKFAPTLKAHYHYGVNRSNDVTIFNDFDIVFTSYGVVLRDVEFLREFKFNYLILDESQAVKNPASRRFKAVNLIQANNRIALSGTPIENSTFDLFAQMSFVNKGFFGGVSSFKENYSNKIDKEGDDNIAAELQRLINPFILRRTKERVASELPPKVEDVIYCEMEAEQRKVYDAYRNQFKSQLLGKIEEDGMGKSKMMVLEALTRLRQICDSPVLLNDDNIDTTESVKIKEIVQHITDKTANHKILIFSQFVKMLGLVKAELTKRNIDFEYLDGQSTTTQRQRSVDNFQENENLRVFLISLKAGGTGLNLTAADYVYILDPWWNPAVENQAIDRCYRIGQDKNVFAYRMICKDTVEEKILNLQNKKRKIAGDIVQVDENIMKTLKTDDINQLFS